MLHLGPVRSSVHELLPHRRLKLPSSQFLLRHPVPRKAQRPTSKNLCMSTVTPLITFSAQLPSFLGLLLQMLRMLNLFWKIPHQTLDPIVPSPNVFNSLKTILIAANSRLTRHSALYVIVGLPSAVPRPIL
jgi:hypothetical protein